MSGGDGGNSAPKEFDERTLNAGRLYSLLRQECDVEDPWHIIVASICAFERLHTKEGWEFVLANRDDIEAVGQLFERAQSPEEFKEGLLKLKDPGPPDALEGNV
ncbi:MAG: hypothetical protein ACRDSJ_17365 [Rubrobacteraceae bacterium]